MASCRPNRATGARTLVLAQEESTWGQVLANPVGTAQGVELISESLGVQIANTGVRHFFGGGAAPLEPLEGVHDASGSIVGELQPHGFWPLVAVHALGRPESTSGSGPYVHVIPGVQFDELPAGLTLEKRFTFPDGQEVFIRYPGSRVNRFSMRASAGGLVAVTADFLCKDEIEGDEALDALPNYPVDNEPFVASAGTLHMDLGSGLVPVASVNSLDLQIDNGMAGDSRVVHEAGRHRIAEGGRTVSGVVSLFFTDETLQAYRQFASQSEMSLEFMLTRDAYEFTVFIPRFHPTGGTPPIIGRGPLNLDVPFLASLDDAEGTDLILTIANTDPSIGTL